jgi:hypothetical protein
VRRKRYWLTPNGFGWIGRPSAAGRYEISNELHDIFYGSDDKGISTLDLYLHGYTWKTIERLTKLGLITDKFSESAKRDMNGI